MHLYFDTKFSVIFLIVLSIMMMRAGLLVYSAIAPIGGFTVFSCSFSFVKELLYQPFRAGNIRPKRKQKATINMHSIIHHGLGLGIG